jgi:hypothetical protein
MKSNTNMDIMWCLSFKSQVWHEMPYSHQHEYTKHSSSYSWRHHVFPGCGVAIHVAFCLLPQTGGKQDSWTTSCAWVPSGSCQSNAVLQTFQRELPPPMSETGNMKGGGSSEVLITTRLRIVMSRDTVILTVTSLAVLNILFYNDMNHSPYVCWYACTFLFNGHLNILGTFVWNCYTPLPHLAQQSFVFRCSDSITVRYNRPAVQSLYMTCAR